VYPSAPILFITADYRQPEEIEKIPTFRNKKVEVLIKPVKLEEIEHSILKLVNNKNETNRSNSLQKNL